MVTKSNDFKNKLLNWLNDQGYPLELRVSQAFMNEKANVTQSDYYTDLESGTPREIDVVSRWYDFFEPKGGIIAELELFTSIECKSQQKNPWIAFSSTSSIFWIADCIPANKDGNALITKARMEKSLESNDLIKMMYRTCHGITQAFTTGKDIPYQAIMGAIKSSESLVQEKETWHKRYREKHDEKHTQNRLANIVIPIVITDARIFEYSLVENSAPELTEVNKTIIHWKYPFEINHQIIEKGRVVLIINESALPWLLTTLQKLRSSLSRHLPALLP